jgi:hypothetical protein
MKRKIYIICAVLAVCILVAGSLYHYSQAYAQTVNPIIDNSSQHNINQQDILNTIVTNLTDEGIPIKSASFIHVQDKDIKPGILINFVIQSLSATDKFAPGDILYVNKIGRAVNLAQNQGLYVGGINYTYFNSRGNKLVQKLEAIHNKDGISSKFNPPQVLDDNTASTLLKNALSFENLVLNKIEISNDACDLREVDFTYSTVDLKEMNAQLSDFINCFRAKISNINTNQNTKISSYQIVLNGPSGERLLIYFNDLLFNNESSWQANSLQSVWYPEPLQDIQN